MTNIEIAVGLLITRISGRTRLDTDQVDAHAGNSLELALRTVHELVAAKLGRDPALERLQIEASDSGEVRPRTHARLIMSLEDAVENDPEFARRLERAVNGVPTENQPKFETGGKVVNQISGTVNGKAIQARDIHGGVNFHGGTRGN